MQIDFLKASDGTGEPVIANIEADRSIGATIIEVDSLDNWGSHFIVITGNLLPNGYIDSADMTIMTAHEDSGDIVIDGFEPGYADVGNTEGQVAIIKMTTGWADRVASRVTPAGVVSDFAGATAPEGWLLCFGQAIDRTDYADLFEAIGTTYGVGDGSTTFNIPDARGRVIAGQDDMGGSSANRLTGLAGGVEGDTLGASGGAETGIHALSDEAYAQIAMFDSAGNSFVDGRVKSPVTAFLSNARVTSPGVVSGVSSTKGVPLRGNTDAGNNVQPTLILNKIIKI